MDKPITEILRVRAETPPGCTGVAETPHVCTGVAKNLPDFNTVSVTPPIGTEKRSGLMNTPEK